MSNVVVGKVVLVMDRIKGPKKSKTPPGKTNNKNSDKKKQGGKKKQSQPKTGRSGSQPQFADAFTRGMLPVNT